MKLLDAGDLYLGAAGGDQIPETQIPVDRILKRDRRIFLAAVLLPFVGSVLALAMLRVQPIGIVDIGLVVAFYVINNIGIEIGYHRLFSHHAFETKSWVRVALAVAGGMAVEGPVSYWVAHHRRHHQHSDRAGDPHSPQLFGRDLSGLLRGLWHSHMGWFFSSERASVGRYARDILEDRAVLKVDRSYFAVLAATLALPAILGGLLSQTLYGAFSGLLWGGFVRIFLVQQVTYSINSLCHSFGSSPFRSHDSSHNISVLSIPTFGGSLHNAHHAFPSTARNSLRWWDIDISWWIIRLLESVGLAWDVKAPTKDAIEAKKL